jgi:hypothetical protein
MQLHKLISMFSLQYHVQDGECYVHVQDNSYRKDQSQTLNRGMEAQEIFPCQLLDAIT